MARLVRLKKYRVATFVFLAQIFTDLYIYLAEINRSSTYSDNELYDSEKTKKTTKKCMSPSYYLEHVAAPEEVHIIVEMQDFTAAMKDWTPSVTMEELQRYNELRKKFAVTGK